MCEKCVCVCVTVCVCVCVCVQVCVLHSNNNTLTVFQIDKKSLSGHVFYMLKQYCFLNLNSEYITVKKNKNK